LNVLFAGGGWRHTVELERQHLTATGRKRAGQRRGLDSSDGRHVRAQPLEEPASSLIFAALVSRVFISA